jgi:quinol monooxygenase YgiN
MMSNLKKFVVVAEFQIKQGCMEAFLKAAKLDATESVLKELGCRQFDIVLSDADNNNVLFYEIYDDRMAFDEHLKTPHLEAFRKTFPALIEKQFPVRFGRRLN